MGMKKVLHVLLMIVAYNSQAQITFQKIFRQPDSASSLQTFDAKPSTDGGYVMTGIASQGANGNVFHPYIIKTNCHGAVEWEHYFGTTQSNGNVNGRVIVTKDSGFVMINNLGVYNNYNGFAVKVDKVGNIVWQKLLNLSAGSDLINDIIETNEGNLILTASVNTIPDVGIAQLDANGNLLWCKTFGNNAQYDEGSAIISTSDGGFMVTGRYISMGTFNAFLLKTDSMGSMQWLKCYGDTLQHTWGFDVKELDNGDYVMVGSTTLLKPNYQSFGDNFIMRLNSVGDTLWTKIFYGNPDQFENASKVIVDNNGDFIVCVATASYVTPGFVPNKHAIMKFSSAGNLLSAKTYNEGGSHYPRLTSTVDGGYLMSGFSTQYTGPVGFQTLLLKLNHNLESGCFENDVTALTTVTSVPFKITNPVPVLNTSGAVFGNNSTYQSGALDSTLCEYFPVLIAHIDTVGNCINQAIQFNADTVGISYWHWNFGDPNTNSDTSNINNPTYTYSTAGTYTVSLTVSNGCDTVSSNIVLKIDNCWAVNATQFEEIKYQFNYYNHILTFANKSDEMLDGKLFDMHGRLLQRFTFAKGITLASLNQYAKGMYILSIHHKNNLLKSEKILIE